MAISAPELRDISSSNMVLYCLILIPFNPCRSAFPFQAAVWAAARFICFTGNVCHEIDGLSFKYGAIYFYIIHQLLFDEYRK